MTQIGGSGVNVPVQRVAVASPVRSVPAPDTHDEGDAALPSIHRPTLRGLDARHRFADG